mmetsp:Transcript_71140/g.137256  ORF Transcript_71140/g.137256 Transcript_71140/m.137256 type:complete len:129 (-) Transcript_71140:10-396(-)
MWIHRLNLCIQAFPSSGSRCMQVRAGVCRCPQVSAGVCAGVCKRICSVVGVCRRIWFSGVLLLEALQSWCGMVRIPHWPQHQGYSDADIVSVRATREPLHGFFNCCKRFTVLCIPVQLLERRGASEWQ